MIVGIDLGTTHSLIGVYEDGSARLLPNGLGDLLTPSAMSLMSDGSLRVGKPALDRLLSHPAQTVANFKRWIGTDREVRLGKKRFRAEELSALVLRSLIADAEHALGKRVSEAVISVPAYFSDAQRRATRAAGQLAGIKVERLINEPTAAALAYGLNEHADDTRFMVCDLGGGTFDVSILEMFDGVVQVHASAGDNHLGGEDFLDVLEEACRRKCGLQDASALNPSARSQLRQVLEQAKHTLTATKSAPAEVEIDLELAGHEIRWALDPKSYERLCEPLLQRIRRPIERALRDSGLTPADMDAVVLVGGATRMSMVPRLISRLFQQLPLRHINPDEAIAQGACVAAGMKARDSALEEIVLTDVCPYTLGVSSVIEGVGSSRQLAFTPIIERNSTVPVSRMKTFYPVSPHQVKVQIDIFQGESPIIEHNIKLGELSLAVPPGKKEEERAIEVRFTYDVNGVLQVEANVRGSSHREELILEQNAGVLTEEEIRKRLQKLAHIKTHPMDQQENIAIIARVERLYEEHLEFRPELTLKLSIFRDALEKQEPEEIARQREALEAMIDRMEKR